MEGLGVQVVFSSSVKLSVFEQSFFCSSGLVVFGTIGVATS